MEGGAEEDFRALQGAQKVQDFTFIVVIVAIAIGFLFAKLYQAFYNFIEDGIWDFYSAGITVMGGLIGGAGTFLLIYFLVGKYIFKGKEDTMEIRLEKAKEKFKDNELVMEQINFICDGLAGRRKIMTAE